MTTEQKTLTKPSPKAQIRDLLQSEDFKRQVGRALPKSMSPERFARVALTATFRNPRLLECSRESLLRCLMELSAIGLEPDGRHAHLIPRKGECTYQLDYKGIAALVRRYGDVSHIHCDVVGDNDQFEYRYGTGGKLEHTPNLNDRGRIYCAYSYVRLKDNSEEFDVMGLEDIERIRKRSAAGSEGPWVTDWNEMAKKTVFRRHSKTLPLSPDLRDAIEHDDEQAYTEQERFAAARPVTATVAGSPRLSRLGRPPKSSVPSEETDNHDQEAEAQAAEPEPAETIAGKPQQAKFRLDEPAPVEQVASLLEQSGHSEADLLTVLRGVRLIDANVQSLAQCPLKALQSVLEDWDNCLDRLKVTKAEV